MVRTFMQIMWVGLAMIAIVLMALGIGFIVGSSDPKPACPTINSKLMVA
jgi:hypothetical protein